jgi:hypothetical protein
MPLDAREVVGILSTFQNMRLGKENAAREADNYAEHVREREAGSNPNAMAVPDATRKRSGHMGLPKGSLDRPLTETRTNVAQQDELGKDLDEFNTAMQLYDASIQRAFTEGAENPEMLKTGEALKAGRELFRKTREEHLASKRKTRARAATGVPVEDAINASKNQLFPFGDSNPAPAKKR